MGPSVCSCLRLTGPSPGTKNLHSLLVIGISSWNIDVRTSSKVLDLSDGSLTNPTFRQGLLLLLSVVARGFPSESSIGRLVFCKSFTNRGPSSDGSTIGFMVLLFNADATRPSRAIERFLIEDVWCKASSVFGCKGNPRGLERFGFFWALSSVGRDLMGEISRCWRFRGDGLFFGCGDGRICGWSVWLW